MGQFIMLGSLLCVILVIVGLVLRFDPEARRDPEVGRVLEVRQDPGTRGDS